MRERALLLFLLGVISAASIGASTKQTLGARSDHYELQVERSVLSPDQVGYDVRVVDLQSRGVVLSSRVAGRPGEAVEATGALGDAQIRVRLAYTPNFFSATVNIVRGPTIVDEFRTWWRLDSRDATQTLATAGEVHGVDAPGVFRVGGDVKAPVAVHRVEPIYPEQARRDQISGIVIVEVLIGSDGRVRDAAVLKPLPDGLSEAALDAIRQWQFRPAMLNGEPVDVVFNLTMSFRLDTAPSPAPPQP